MRRPRSLTRSLKGLPVAKRQKSDGVRFAGVGRRDRRGLLITTALQSAGIMLLAFPAMAQLSPTARPTGGQVVAGQASIGQTTAQTSVTQSSQRAAIDWRSYDVGSQHTVTYQQPNSSAVILNRVTGPDPSQIAGRISANGQVVIVNGSGVVFHQGSVVDAQGLVVSAPGITNRNFMAGRMRFDIAPRPGAEISNAGTITVGQSGLAALVAPQVSNAGTIQARMGHVVLAGAEAHVVDLYGDGLMSVDVTKQVRTAPGGGRALVTNTGTVSAEGGTVTLTAAAADGIVSNLIHAGGRISADSLPGRPGQVVINGVGGSITVAGTVRSNGRDGAGGGTIQLNATDTVTLADTARVSASGRGGGTIAVGTTAARAQAQGTATDVFPAGTARRAVVAAGARIGADGRSSGSGGTVAVLSTESTAMAGRITARGGANGGDGGRVEISGKQGLRINGTADVSAAKGRAGTILIDPRNLTISENGTDPDPTVPAPADANISVTVFNGLIGNVSLTATQDITTTNTTALGTASQTGITFTAGNNLTIGGPLGLSGIPITLVATAGSVTQSAAGAITALSLSATAGTNVTLNAATNSVASLGPVTAGGSVSVSTAVPLTLTGSLAAGGTLTLGAPAIVQASGGIAASLLTATASGSITLTSTGNSFGTLGAVTAGGNLALSTGAALTLTDRVAAGGGAITLAAPSIAVGASAGTAASLRFGTVTGGVFTETATAGSVVTLQTDTLALFASATGPAIRAPSGTVNVAPLTPGRVLSLDPTGSPIAGQLSLTPATLAQISTAAPGSVAPNGTGTLRLGWRGDATTPTAGALQINTAVDLTNTAATLGLYAKAITTGTGAGTVTSTGNITAAAGAGITLGSQANGTTYAGVLTGAADGAVTLGTVPGTAASGFAAPANHFDVLQDFTAGNGLSIAMATTATQGRAGLVLRGTVTGGPSLSLLSVGLNTAGTYAGGTIRLGDATQAATVSASNVTLATRDGAATAPAITQNGTLAAGRLTGSVLTADTGTAYNVALTSTTNAVADLAGFTVGRPNADGTVLTQGAFALSTLGTLTVDAPVAQPVVAGTVAILAGDLVVSGNVGAPGPVTLASAGSVTINGGITGSLDTLTLASAGGATITGGTVDATNRINVTGPLGVEGGRIYSNSISVPGALAQSGGVLATNLLLNPDFTLSGGQVYAGNGFNAKSPGLSGGSLLGAGGGTITITATTPTFSSDARIAASGDVRILLPGSFAQGAAGSIVAGQNLAITGLDGTAPAPGTISAAGTLAAGGALTLLSSGSGPATISATLAGATVTVSQPGADLSFSGTTKGAATLSPAPGFTARYHCLGCNLPPATLDISNPVPTLSGTPALVRLDGRNLTLTGAIAATAVELHSVLDTRQTGGSITAGTLTGTAGYAATINPGALPSFAVPGAQGVAVLTSATNAVDTLLNYSARGNDATREGFSLTDAKLLAVTGQVLAGLAPTPLTASGLATTGNNLTLTVIGNLGLAAGSTLAGSTVRLATTGTIAEAPGGRVVAGMLTGSAAAASFGTTTDGNPGGLGNQIGTLADFIAATGGFSLVNSRSLQVTNLSAAGPVSVVAQSGRNTPSAAEGQAAGNLSVSVISGSAVTLEAYGDLTGSTVTGAAVNLTAGRDVALSNVGATVLSGEAGRNFGVGGGFGTVSRAVADTGSLTLSDSVSLTLAGPAFGRTAATIAAPTVVASADISSGGDVRLRATGPAGTITQTGGTVAAQGSLFLSGASDTTPAGGTIRQNAGLLAARGEVRIYTAADAIQAGGLLLGTTVQVLAPNGSNTFAPTQSAATVTIGNPGVDLTGVRPSFAGYAAPGATAGARPGFLRLDGATLALTRPITADTIELHSTGNTTQTAAGTVTTNLLRGTAGDPASLPAGSLPTYAAAGSSGSAILANPANSFATVGYYQAAGDLSLRTTGDMVLLGPVASWRQPFAAAPITGLAAETGTGAVTLQASGAITLGTAAAAAQLAGRTVDLRAGTSITEPNGQLAAGTLTGSAAGPASLTAGTNQVAGLGGFTAGTSFTLTDGRDLTVSGPVVAPTIGIAAGNLDLPGLLNGSASVALNSSGSIRQDAGAAGISTASLTVAATGDASLAATANQVTSLGSAGAGGTFLLVDGRTLTVAGPVTAAAVGLSAPGLDLPGRITGSASVTLSSTGDIQQSAGAAGISTLRLSGSASGTASLNSVANAVVNLGSFTAGTALSFNDGQALTVAGPVTAPTVRLTAPGISLPGRVGATGLVELISSGDILQAADATGIAAGSLSATAIGRVALDATANQVDNLVGSTAGSSFSFADGRALTVTGPLTAAAVDLSAPGLFLPGRISGTDSVRLTSSQSILQDTAAAGIETASLSGSALSGATFGSASNRIVALGRFTAGSGLSLQDGRELTVTGPVAATTVTLSAPGLVLPGRIAATSAVDLSSTGDIRQAATADGIATGTLTATATGAVTLAAPTNQVAVLGSLKAGGAATVVDGRSLTVSGPVTAPDVALTAAGLSLPGRITGQATVRLVSTADIDQSAAAAGISAPSLTGTAAGSATLNATANRVATLGDFSAGTTLSLVDGQALTVAGTVAADSVALTAPGLVLPGRIAGTREVRLVSGDGIVQDTAAGGIATAVLTGSAVNGIALLAAANQVTTLGAVNTDTGLTLVDGRALTVTGPVLAATVNLAAPGLTLPGGITATGTVQLSSSGSIQQDADAAGITTPILSGSASGGAMLLAAANQVQTLGAFTTGTSFALVDGRALSVTGPVAAGTDLQLRTQSGNLVLRGNLQAPGRLDLAGAEGLSQLSGTLSATELALSSGGDLGLASSVTARGALTARAAGTLTQSVGSSIRSGNETLLATGSDLFLAGSLDAGSLRAGAGGTIALAGSSRVESTGPAALSAGNAANLAGTLTAAGPLEIGAGRELTVAGTVRTTAGAATLTAAEGPLSLTTGAVLATSGPASLSAGTSLVLGGTLSSDGTVALKAGDAASLSGTVTASTAVSVDAGRTVTLSGAVAAPRLSVGGASSPATVTLSGGSIAVGGTVQTVGSALSLLPAAAGGIAPGAFISGGRLVQTGTTVVAPLAGTAQATIRVDVSGGIRFTNLDARNANLVLNLGTGTATGEIKVNSLSVLYAGGGSAELTGTVRDPLNGTTLAGDAAAAAGRIGRTFGSGTVALSDRQYRLNGCAIASINCVVFTADRVPVTNPLKEIDLSFFGRQDDDAELLVPNITDQGL